MYSQNTLTAQPFGFLCEAFKPAINSAAFGLISSTPRYTICAKKEKNLTSRPVKIFSLLPSDAKQWLLFF